MVTPPRPSAWFLARSAWQRLLVDVHRLLRVDRRYQVGRYELRLPPAHRLPWFQRLFPTYDTYAAPLLAELCRPFQRPVLVDVGVDKPVDVALVSRSAHVRLGARETPANEPPLLVADVRRLRDELGWRPRRELTASLTETVNWWRTARAA